MTRRDRIRINILIAVKILLGAIAALGLTMYIMTGGERGAIRERKKVESMLSEALAMSEVAYWRWDLENDELHWSPYLREVFGIHSDRMSTFKEWAQIVHPDDRERAVEIALSAKEGGRPYTLVYRVIGDDGVIRTIFETAVTAYDGSIMVGTCKLIAETPESE